MSMKKIIIALSVFMFLTTAMVSFAHADSGTVSFNNDPKDLPTDAGSLQLQQTRATWFLCKSITITLVQQLQLTQH
jgi:hypothetical protein